MDERTRALALRRRQLLSLPPVERVAAILGAPRPADLVRLLPAQELFLTLVEAGLDAALPLLAHASTHQVEFLFDVDGWERDRFESGPAGEWLAALHQADPEAVVRWLREADEELVVLALTRLLHVYKLDESSDPAFWPPDRPVGTLDGTYYVEQRDEAPDAAAVALWGGLTRLRVVDRPAYEALLERVLWAVPPELEEGAYQRRISRMAEKGFPEFDEAAEVWAAAPGDPARIARRLAELPDPVGGSGVAGPGEAGPGSSAAGDGGAVDAGADDAAPEAADPSLLPVPLRAPGLTRLGEAALRLPVEQRERLVADLVRLGNRFAVASLAPLGDPGTHQDGLATALGMVNIGLLELAGGDLRRLGPKALAGLSVFDLNRAGVAAVRQRAARARALAAGWLARVRRARERLDPERRDLLDGLLQARPVFAGPEAGLEEARPFRDAADLAAADATLDVLDALGAFLEGRLGAGPEELPELDPPPLYRGPDEVDWFSVALTTVANVVLGRPARPAPLDRGAAADAAGAMLSAGTPRRVTPRFHEACAALGLGPLAGALAARLEDDLGLLEPGADIDPRVATALLRR